MKEKSKTLKKALALVLSLSLVMAFSAGCGGGESESSTDEIRFGLAYEPETLDVSNYSGDTAQKVIRLCTEQLLRNVDGQAEPGIAESYDVSEDSKTYTFHLRDCTFADGTEITANDVYYGIMRTLDPNKGLECAYHLYEVVGAESYNMGEGKAEDVGVKVIDEKTLEITTEEASYPLYYTDSAFTPLNEKQIEEAGDAYGSEANLFCMNGPYNLTEWTHESEVVLEKNPDYWNADAIKTEKLVGKINVDGQTAYDMMTAGELDVCTITNDMTIVEELLATGDYEDYSYSAGAQMLYINHKGKTEETGKWLSNTNFRKALSFAIDREALVKAVLTADTPATRLSSPSLQGVEKAFNEEYPYEAWKTTADEAAAKECMEKAMKEMNVSSVDEIPEFTLLCTDSNTNMSYLNAISDMWKKTLGVKSVIDAQPLSSMLDKMDNTGDFDLVKGGKDFGIVDWTGEIASFYISGAGNPNNNNNKDYDQLYYKTVKSKDWKERKDNIFEVEKYFCDNALSIMVTWIGGHDVHANNIQGIKTTSHGYSDYTYIEKK